MKVRDAATILDDAPTYSPPGDWRQRGACRGLDPNLFVTGRGESTAEAKAVCLSCPSLHECAVAGICDPQIKGVWGGLSERERRQARPIPALLEAFPMHSLSSRATALAAPLSSVPPIDTAAAATLTAARQLLPQLERGQRIDAAIRG